MDRRFFIKAVPSVLGAAAVPALLARPAQAAVQWDMIQIYNATSAQAQSDMRFIERLAELTDGAVSITLHPGGALGYAAQDHFDAVSDGAVQLADTLSGNMVSIDPLFGLTSLPFVAQSFEEARRLWDTARPYYDEIFASHGQKLLFATPDIPTGVWADRPITSIEDLRSLRIRTYDLNGTVTLQAAGASPLQIAWGDVVPQLATNGIDAVLTGLEGGMLLALWEYVPYFTELNYAMPLHMAHVNLDEFERLDTEIQNAVDQAAEETIEHIWTTQPERVETSTRIVEEHGGTIVSDVDQGFRDALSVAAEEPLNRWLDATGERGAELIAAYRG